MGGTTMNQLTAPSGGDAVMVMAGQPFLARVDVAALIGARPDTVSRYLTRSRPGGRYETDPFPAPDGRAAGGPWWRPERAEEIRAWCERRRDRSGVGGRPSRGGVAG